MKDSDIIVINGKEQTIAEYNEEHKTIIQDPYKKNNMEYHEDLKKAIYENLKRKEVKENV